MAGLALAVWLLARHGHAGAPLGRYTFFDAGLVLDSKTGLLWQRTTSPDGYSFDQAGAYCRSLTLDGTGWRLPSVKELHTIVDIAREIPAADPTAFPDAMSLQYWTSSPLVGDRTAAWVIDFRSGAAKTTSADEANQARCVR
jgi:Protein of unknown function (DUF1566)